MPNYTETVLEITGNRSNGDLTFLDQIIVSMYREWWRDCKTVSS